MSKSGAPAATLKKSLNLPLLVLYGLGTTIGAGIYSLVGEIARVAGYFSSLSFLCAALLAGFTALSFAELSARYPRAAGVALYVQQGFSSRRLALFVGLLVVFAGVVSSAALLNAFVGYLQVFFGVHRVVIICAVAFVIGLIAIWGILESVVIASVITLVEVIGLLVIVWVNMPALMTLPERLPELIPPLQGSAWYGIYLGLGLAFYAFIGFEDMVDVAEEVKDVKRNLPLAILLTLVLTTVLYALLMTVAVLALPPATLGSSGAPLRALYIAGTGGSADYISIVALFAIINGALIQIIMSSRVLYGLGSRRQLPSILSSVNARTRTPAVATTVAVCLMLTFALIGSLAFLAQLTSTIILILFTLVNTALVRIKLREVLVEDVLNLPIWLPVCGAIASGGVVLAQFYSLLFSA